jgi:hypothetical protein
MNGSQLHIHIRHDGILLSYFLNILCIQLASKTLAGATVEHLFVTDVLSSWAELAVVGVQHRPVTSDVIVMTEVAGNRQHFYLPCQSN